MGKHKAASWVYFGDDVLHGTQLSNHPLTRGFLMAQLKLRKAKGTSANATRAKGSGGKKAKAKAAGGRARGGVPYSGQSSGGGNSDVPF